MEEKKGFSKKLNAFFAGKGFYIVLLLCAVLVGASFWLVGRGSGADVERDPVKETNITASAQETAPPQGSIPVMNTEEDERLPLGTGVLPAAEGGERERSAVHPSGKRRAASRLQRGGALL